MKLGIKKQDTIHKIGCKVLLINPSISGYEVSGEYKDVGSLLHPYGLLSIGAVLEKHGHTVKLSDFDSRKYSKDDIKNAIVDFIPDVIGITVYSSILNNVLQMTEFIKTFSKALIVAGGPHIILSSDNSANSDYFDLQCYCEGEYVMLDIIEYFLGHKTLEQIDGIIYKENGQVIKTKHREHITNLDELPYPALHLLEDINHYRPAIPLFKRKPVMTLIAGRGCPFNCTFCSSIWGKNVRLNSAPYIFGLMKHMINDFGVKEIMFHEDTFCINKDRIHQLCDLIIKENIDIIWSCSLNIRTVDEPLLRKMKKAGCWLISVGIESGNNEILKFINKPITVEEAIRVCAWADDAGLMIRGFFMLGHLIETKQTIRQTIDFSKSLPLFAINISIVTIFPGSKIYEIANEYGEAKYDVLYGLQSEESLNFVTKGLTAQYLIKMKRRWYREFFLRPSQILRILKNIDSMNDIKNYLILLKTFLKQYL